MDAARIDPRLAGSPVSRSLSLLPASSGQRVLAAGGLVALLWLLVWWALD